MKKLIFALIVLMFTVPAFCDQSQKFYIDYGYEMIADGSEVPLPGFILAASATETFTKDFDTMRPVGFASLQVEISGSGTLKIIHESSNDGVSYNTATVNGTTASDIVTALTSGSEIYQFDLPFARHFRIKFEETGGANGIIIENITFAVQ